MANVIIYTTYYCPYCSAAKSLLRSKNVDFTEIDVSADRQLRTKMEQLSGRRTVPQIFINGKPIGGYDDARELEAAGELDILLNEALPSS